MGSKVKREAELVRRLKAKGAIVLGKTNLSEWSRWKAYNQCVPQPWKTRRHEKKAVVSLTVESARISSSSCLPFLCLTSVRSGIYLIPTLWSCLLRIDCLVSRVANTCDTFLQCRSADQRLDGCLTTSTSLSCRLPPRKSLLATCLRRTNGWSALGGRTLSAYVPGPLNRSADIPNDTCGSSAGSCVAVSAGLAAASVSTETEGSIICPANRAGLFGLKPSVGWVESSLLANRRLILPFLADSYLARA